MLRLFNSMGRQIAPVTARHRDHLLMCVCRPTVYSYANIGTARPPVDSTNREL